MIHKREIKDKDTYLFEMACPSNKTGKYYKNPIASFNPIIKYNL